MFFNKINKIKISSEFLDSSRIEIYSTTDGQLLVEKFLFQPFINNFLLSHFAREYTLAVAHMRCLVTMRVYCGTIVQIQ